MTTIGSFSKTNEGFTGVISTLQMTAKARLIPVIERDSDKAPDYRLFVGAYECGAAWRKPKSKSGREMLSFRFDDPSFAQPINALLIQDDGEPTRFALIWSRQA